MGTEVVIRSVAEVEPLSGRIRYVVSDDEDRDHTTKARATQDGTAFDAAPWMPSTREPNGD